MNGVVWCDDKSDRDIKSFLVTVTDMVLLVLIPHCCFPVSGPWVYKGGKCGRDGDSDGAFASRFFSFLPFPLPLAIHTSSKSKCGEHWIVPCVFNIEARLTMGIGIIIAVHSSPTVPVFSSLFESNRYIIEHACTTCNTIKRRTGKGPAKTHPVSISI